MEVAFTFTGKKCTLYTCFKILFFFKPLWKLLVDMVSKFFDIIMFNYFNSVAV